MHIEFEVRILEIDYDDIIRRLDGIGAKFEWDLIQKRYTYDFKPRDSKRWIRLRTNGKTTTLTFKNIIKSAIDGTEEEEIEVSDFDVCHSMLSKLGYEPKAFQENRRIQYNYKGVEIDIDFWPFIPTYLEIEGRSEEEVYEVVRALGFSESDVTALDVDSIYKHYGYNLDDVFELKLEEERK
ncbi:MAG: CYTH domain-containing protein [Bacilli bacterium]|nr:CYTH domain-containing protein [Bacilli bacterium]